MINSHGPSLVPWGTPAGIASQRGGGDKLQDYPMTGDVLDQSQEGDVNSVSESTTIPNKSHNTTALKYMPLHAQIQYLPAFLNV